jgi:protein-L-isoaspartate O-methyltransferase
MLAILGVNNPAIEAAYAAVPREAFLGPPPWTVSSPFTGDWPLSGREPVVLYQDVLIALDPARGVNNGSLSLHAKLLAALAPKRGDRIVHVGAGTAITARFWPSWSARSARPGRPGHGGQVQRGAGRAGEGFPRQS